MRLRYPVGQCTRSGLILMDVSVCAHVTGKAGAKPVFSDAELITLVSAQDFLPFPRSGLINST